MRKKALEAFISIFNGELTPAPPPLFQPRNNRKKAKKKHKQTPLPAVYYAPHFFRISFFVIF